MKPTLKSLVSLQFILLLILSIHYIATLSQLDKIEHLLIKLHDSKEAAEFDSLKHHRDRISLSTTSQLNVEESLPIESQFNKSELGLIKSLLTQVIEPHIEKQSSVNRLETPIESEIYFSLNDQVSNYILQGDISEQAFVKLSQEMLAIHPTQRGQLLKRLAKELNKQ